MYFMATTTNEGQELKFDVEGEIVGEKEYVEWLNAMFPDQLQIARNMISKLRNNIQKNEDISADG